MLTYIVKNNDLGTNVELSHRTELCESHAERCLSATCQ